MHRRGYCRSDTAGRGGVGELLLLLWLLLLRLRVGLLHRMRSRLLPRLHWLPRIHLWDALPVRSSRRHVAGSSWSLLYDGCWHPALLLHHLRVGRTGASHHLLAAGHHLLLVLLLLLHAYHVHPLLLLKGHLGVHLLHPLLLQVLLLHHHLVLLWRHVLHPLLLLLLHGIGELLLQVLRGHRSSGPHVWIPSGPHLRPARHRSSLHVYHALRSDVAVWLLLLLLHARLRLPLAHHLGVVLLTHLLLLLLLLLHRLLLFRPVVAHEHVVLPMLLSDLVQGLLQVGGARRDPEQLRLVHLAQLRTVLLHRPLFRV